MAAKRYSATLTFDIDKAVYAVIFSFSGILHTQYAQYFPDLKNDCRNLNQYNS